VSEEPSPSSLPRVTVTKQYLDPPNAVLPKQPKDAEGALNWESMSRQSSKRAARMVASGFSKLRSINRVLLSPHERSFAVSAGSG
jgi:hypothetical protein